MFVWVEGNKKNMTIYTEISHTQQKAIRLLRVAVVWMDGYLRVKLGTSMMEPRGAKAG